MNQQHTDTARLWNYNQAQANGRQDIETAPQKTLAAAAHEPFVYEHNFFDLHFPFSNARNTTGILLEPFEKMLVHLSAFGLVLLLIATTPLVMMAEFVSEKRERQVSVARFALTFIPRLMVKEITLLTGLLTTGMLIMFNFMKTLAAPFQKFLFEKKKSQAGNLYLSAKK